MNMCDLRELCIQRDWFTMATSEQYDSFLRLTNGEITTERLHQMAEMVTWFSEQENIEGMEITDIMFELNRVAFTTFTEENEEAHDENRY